LSTIPASDLVAVTPSVLAAGGTGLDLTGLFLTLTARVPLGTVSTFTSQAAVASYFGASSQEAALASIYFEGFSTKSKIPGALKFATYNQLASAAYLRGGNISGLTLAQLQAISGSLNVTVDGYPRNASSVNLSSATSFSSAAALIQTALNAVDPSEASVTASIGASMTASIGTTVLTVSAVSGGIISVGDTVVGAGVAANTVITSPGTGTGGTGTYNINNSQTVGSESMTTNSNVLDVTALLSGAVAPGQSVTGAGVTEVVVLAQLTGTTGGVGTYSLAGAAQHVASETMTLVGTPVTVTYDSVSGAFIITSGITGVASTIAFATGTIAATLLMTLATGAVLSQGAGAAIPASFMGALIAVDRQWANFATTFDPDGGSGNTVKQAFAAWVTTQNDRYAYVTWDTDASPTATSPATSSLGYILEQAENSTTMLMWAVDSTQGPIKAAFVMGTAASINFTQTAGRITFAYKSQGGLVADVTTETAAANLLANGYNFYGAYGAANANFIFLQNGKTTGPFEWFDSFENQIWLNQGFQSDLLTLLSNLNSLPYTTAGNSLISQALTPRIKQALAFGAFAPGNIAADQIAQVNAMAGIDISNVLQTQGWYLQILPASSTVRAARGSPPATFWYLDRGSVQQINLASVAVQ
jgi:hypothetical protein